MKDLLGKKGVVAMVVAGVMLLVGVVTFVVTKLKK